MTTAPAPAFRRVVVERDPVSGYLVMWIDGKVEWQRSKRDVVTAVKRTAAAGFDVAMVEWRT